MKTIREIYEQFREGGHLTDDELLLGIEYFGDLAHKAAVVGPAYSLVARDARMTSNALNDFLVSRRRGR